MQTVMVELKQVNVSVSKNKTISQNMQMESVEVGLLL